MKKVCCALFFDTSEVEDQREHSAGRRGLACFLPGCSRELKDKSGQESHRAVQSKEVWRKQKTRTLWAMKEANEGGEECYDSNHQQEIQKRDRIDVRLWTMYPISPTAALAKAFECQKQSACEFDATNEL